MNDGIGCMWAGLCSQVEVMCPVQHAREMLHVGMHVSPLPWFLLQANQVRVKEGKHTSLPRSVHSLSIAKTSAVPPRGHTWQPGTMSGNSGTQRQGTQAHPSVDMPWGLLTTVPAMGKWHRQKGLIALDLNPSRRKTLWTKPGLRGVAAGVGRNIAVEGGAGPSSGGYHDDRTSKQRGRVLSYHSTLSIALMCCQTPFIMGTFKIEPQVCYASWITSDWGRSGGTTSWMVKHTSNSVMWAQTTTWSPWGCSWASWSPNHVPRSGMTGKHPQWPWPWQQYGGGEEILPAAGQGRKSAEINTGDSLLQMKRWPGCVCPWWIES